MTIFQEKLSSIRPRFEKVWVFFQESVVIRKATKQRPMKIMAGCIF